MKKILVCGSYAFDSIMAFADKFKNHILADKLHMINVCFYVPNMRKEFGGCAGNIAYNLKLLGENVQPMAVVGNDFLDYQARLDELGIDSSYIKKIKDNYTAQAFITTDIDDNQITAFHPGAMDNSHLNNIVKLQPQADIAIISPDGKQGMIEHAQQLHTLNIPFIFDPGQGLPMFNKAELLLFIQQASWLSVNDYEFEMIKRTTELTTKQITAQVKALIVTKGANGCDIHLPDKTLSVAGIKAEAIDPTGCGDAYRAGIIFGINNNLDWQTTARLANIIGAIKVSVKGTQNHNFTLDSIKDAYYQHYQETML